MPEWLLQKDEYVPSKGGDSFISKSILSLFGVIGRFRRHTAQNKDTSRLNPGLKVFATFIMVLLISTSRSTTLISITAAYVLISLCLLQGRDIAYIVKVSFVTGIFTAVILVPSILQGNTVNSSMLIIKVLMSVAVVNILSVTTPWNDITGALKLFRVPDTMIFILDVTIKYIVLLSEFALDMTQALKLRSVGSSENKNKALTAVMGTVFLKSKVMTEEMHSAMECRGFTGEYYSLKKLSLSFYDFLYIIVNVALIIAYFFIDRL